MIGITSYGAYVPRTRLPFAVIGGRKPAEGGPERSVAWNDEDAITQGVTAAIHCLEGLDRSQVDMLLFASTTLPFQESCRRARRAGPRPGARGADRRPHGLDPRRHRRPSRCDRRGQGRLRALRSGIASDARMAAPKSGMEATSGTAPPPS